MDKKGIRKKVSGPINTWPLKDIDEETYIQVNLCDSFKLLTDKLPQKALLAWEESVKDDDEYEEDIEIYEPKWIVTEVLTVKRSRYEHKEETVYQFGVLHDEFIEINGIYDPLETVPTTTLLNHEASMGLELAIRRNEYSLKDKPVDILYIHHLQRRCKFPDPGGMLDAELNDQTQPSIKIGEKLVSFVRAWTKVARMFGRSFKCDGVLLHDAAEVLHGKHEISLLMIRYIQGFPTIYDIKPIKSKLLKQISKDKKGRKRISIYDEESSKALLVFKIPWSQLFRKARDKIKIFADEIGNKNGTIGEVLYDWYKEQKHKSFDEIKVLYDKIKSAGGQTSGKVHEKFYLSTILKYVCENLHDIVEDSNKSIDSYLCYKNRGDIDKYLTACFRYHAHFYFPITDIADGDILMNGVKTYEQLYDSCIDGIIS